MIAGSSRINITPGTDVWMDGMIRAHKSSGIHDQIFVRALVMAQDMNMSGACAIVSVEVCGLKDQDTGKVRKLISEKTGIPAENIIIAATHTHSGPATIGFFNPSEKAYLEEFLLKIKKAVIEAKKAAKPVMVGCYSGYEDTISHYRRLLTDNGQVVMNWESWQPEKIVGPLGKVDSEVGVLKIVDEKKTGEVMCILFNHAGHPNVMSGDNYLISGDYTGLAMRLLEDKFSSSAMFVNGAQGTMDIDGQRDRDWEGVERTGEALAAAVSETARKIVPSQLVNLRTGYAKYALPARIITPEELLWSAQVLENTGGKVQAITDGVGDDYKALLYKRLNENRDREITVEQTCIAMNDTAFISFPGELFTEIGMHIKAKSPFARTYIIGLANGEIGYVPTGKAICEGGYAVDTREVGDEAEDIVVSRSLALLEQVYHGKTNKAD